MAIAILSVDQGWKFLARKKHEVTLKRKESLAGRVELSGGYLSMLQTGDMSCIM